MGQYMTLSQEGSLATLSFRTEKGLNILSSEVLAELDQTWSAVESQPRTRVCILHGDGKVFIAGANIKEMAQLDPSGACAFAERGQHIFTRIQNSRVVSIAALHGAALGGGCELALACDIRIAAEGLKIGQPEVNLGLIPGFGGTQRLPRIVGLGNALHLILSGEALSAEQALRIGLVTKVTPPELLLEQARTLAGLVAEKGPRAVALAKRCVLQSGAASLEPGLALEREDFSKCFASGEAQEGLRAFIEKRKAAFG